MTPKAEGEMERVREEGWPTRPRAAYAVGSLLAITIVSLLVLAASWVSSRPGDQVPVSHAEAFVTTSTPTREKYVVYRLSGTASELELTMTNARGEVEQHAVELPLTMPSTGEPVDGIAMRVPVGGKLYLEARVITSGTIFCSIEIDGKIAHRDIGAGPGAVATCSTFA